jgi:hypothetical protein
MEGIQVMDATPWRPVLIVALAVILAYTPSASAVPVDGEWARRWRADLETVRVEIPNVHANAFHTISRDEWNAAIDDLERRVPSLEHHRIIVELAKLIVRIGDGHTRLTLPVVHGHGRSIAHTPTTEPKDPALELHNLPLRLYLYADGLYVREIDAAYGKHAGAKVVRVGTMTAAEAMAAVAPTIQRDNEQQVASQLPFNLMIPELLHAVGVTPEPGRAAFEFESASGTRTSVMLEPLHRPVEWVAARPPGEAPLYLRNADSKFWFTDLPEQRALYVRINEVQDTKEEALSEFADRLFDAFDSGPAVRMIVDLRNNSGGDNTLIQGLIHRVLCSAKLKEPASLFVVIDRGTFSAAMNLVTELEKSTTAVFIGEATGASPNSYGDSRKTVLPNTGLTIRASTLFWQKSDPRDDRSSTEPHLAVPISSKDAAAGRDPVLGMLAELWSRPSGPDGTWSGTATYRFQRFPVTLEIRKSGMEWEGWLTSAALEMERAPVGNIRSDARTLSFDLPSPLGTALPTRVWLGADAMVGSGESRGRTLLVSMRRER